MFYLFANCNFKPDHYAAWQAAYDDLDAHVEPNEPTTMTYYFGIPLDYADDFAKTTSMPAFEVYGKRELSRRFPRPRRRQAGVRHNARPEDSVQIPHLTHSKHLKSLTHKVSQSEKARPSGVLTFMAFESLDDEDGARLYSRFESREAMEAFIRRQEVDAFWQTVKGEVRGMEQRGYLPNGKGWLHRGGRTKELRAKL